MLGHSGTKLSVGFVRLENQGIMGALLTIKTR